MTDSQRIKKVIEVTNQKSISAFARSIGYERPEIIRRIIAEENGISAKVARNIVNTYPNFNFSWLLTGEGDMLSETIDNEVKDLLFEHQKNQVSNLTTALSIIESQQEALQKMSEAALIQAQSMSRLIEKLEGNPDEVSKAV